MLTTVGGVVLPRFWHSLTWNRSTISAPKQLPLYPDLDLLHSFGHVLKPETSDPWGFRLLTAKMLQMSNFK